MLEAEGNTILVAQNKIGGSTTELIDLSGNSKPANIAFSAELSRAQESISDQTAESEQTIVTAAELNNIVGNKVMPSSTEESGGTSLGPQPILDGLSALSQNINATHNGIDDSQVTLLGVRATQEDESLIDVLATAETDVAEEKQSQALKNPINPELTLPSEIEPSSIEAPESSSTVDDSNLLTGLKTASVAPTFAQTQQGAVAQSPVNELKPAEGESQAFNIASKTIPNPVSNAVSNTVPVSIAPANLSVVDSEDLKPAAQVLDKVPEKVNTSDRPVPVPVAIADRTITSKTTASSETTVVTKAGVQTDDIKVDGNQSVNSALLYKPSPGLVESGLGRTSVELNNGVKSTTQAIKPELSSPSMSLNPSLSSSVGSNSNTVVVSDEVDVLPVANQLRAVGNWQSVSADERLSNVVGTTAPIANSDESTQGVSFQTVNNPTSPVGLTNIPAQTPLAEIAIPKGSGNIAETADVTSNDTDTIARVNGDTNLGGSNFGGGESKNPQQQLAQTAVTIIDDDVALTQPRESVVVEQQNKFSNVTPGISLKQVVKPDQSVNITGMQSISGTAELTSSNVYHATSNGIITAHSNPLNTGPVTDLASAPRTVLLGQPGADESLVENLRWVVNEKLSRATINVSPANLGPITVSVDVENQNMNVSIVANNTIAKDAIDSLLPRMREHFGNEGYQQVSVDVSSQQERQGNLRNQSGFSLEQEGGAETDTRDADTRDNELVREENRSNFDDQRTSQSLIDTYV